MLKPAKQILGQRDDGPQPASRRFATGRCFPTFPAYQRLLSSGQEMHSRKRPHRCIGRGGSQPQQRGATVAKQIQNDPRQLVHGHLPQFQWTMFSVNNHQRRSDQVFEHPVLKICAFVGQQPGIGETAVVGAQERRMVPEQHDQRLRILRPQILQKGHQFT